MTRTAWIAGICAAVPAAAALLSSCSTASLTLANPPTISGARFVGNQACQDCHADIVRQFPGSPHARLHFEGANRAGQSGCESCHGPGSKHLEAGAHKEQFIVNPGKNPAACFECHLQTHAEFTLPYHHPVTDGRMNCVQCHEPHGADIFKPAGAVGLAMARSNDTCAQCHRDQTRLVTFEHEALREGCSACHNPHGSVNRKMLVGADANLCLRCHAQNQDPAAGSGAIYIGAVDHTSFLRQSTCWASGCHTAVHGSNLDPWLRY